jgi:hypothetical protein
MLGAAAHRDTYFLVSYSFHLWRRVVSLSERIGTLLRKVAGLPLALEAPE